MEEGVPPLPYGPIDPNTATANHTHDIDTTEPTNHNNDSNSALVPYNKDTYIIQVPKEQIFRVPPPENAKIIEEYLNRNKKGSQTAQHCSRLTYVIAIVFIIVLLCLSALVGFYFLASPSFPNFMIDHVTTVGKKADFNVMIRVHNPSTVMDFRYDTAAEVDLSYRGKTIAYGELPTFEIVHYDTKEIKVSLKGSKNGLPKEIDISPKGSKKVVPLSLAVEIPVKLGFGALQIREKIIKVNCDFRVSKWGKDMHTVSQTCNTKI